MPSLHHRRVATSLVLAAVGFCLALAGVASAAATPVGDYGFQDSLTSTGGAPALTAVGAGVESYPTERVLDNGASATSGTEWKVGVVPAGAGLRIPTGAGSIAADHYSVSMLVRPDGTSSYHRVLADFSGTGAGSPMLYVTGTRTLVFSGPGGSVTKAESPSVLPVDALAHVTITRDKATKLVSVYVDRTLEFSFTDSHDAAVIQNGALHLFQQNSGYQTSWSIARIRTFASAIPAADVTTFDSNRLPPAPDRQQTGATPPAPLADYRLEETLGRNGGGGELSLFAHDAANWQQARLHGANRKVLDVAMGQGADAPVAADDPRNAYTIAALLRIDSIGSYHRQLISTDGDSRDGLFVHGDGRLGYGAFGRVGDSGPIAFSTDKFSQFVLTRDETGKVTAYFDGSKVLEGADNGKLGYLTSAIKFLHQPNGYQSGGEIARIRTWDYPLTAAQVSSIELDRATVAADGKPAGGSAATPVADYHLEGSLDKEGTTANPLAALGDPDFRTARVLGAQRQVLDFDQGEGLNVPGLRGVLARNAWTVSALVRFDEFGSHHRLVFSPHAAADNGLSVYADNKLNVWGGPASTVVPDTALDYNRFRQITFSRDESGTLTAYLDGVKQYEAQDSGRSHLLDGDVIRLFAQSNGYQTGGEVARVRVWDYGMPAAQIPSIEADRATVAADTKPQGSTAAQPAADYRLEGSLEKQGSAENPLAAIGDPDFQTARVLGAQRRVLDFDSGEGLNVTGLRGVLARNAWTVSALVRFDQFGSHHRLIFSPHATADNGLSVFGDAKLGVWNGPGNTITPPTALDYNRFRQITFSRDESGMLRAYIDGVKQYEALDAGRSHVLADDALRLFAHGSYHTGGEVARVRVWDYGMPEAQIASIEADRATVAADAKPQGTEAADPLADYRLEGTLAKEDSEADPLTEIGDTDFELARVDGGRREVLDFDSGEGLDIPGLLGKLPRNSWSVSALVRFDAYNSHHRLIFAPGSIDRGLSLFTEGRIGMWNGPSSTVPSTTVFGKDPFRQVTYTRDEEGTLRGYVDGVKEYEATDVSRAQLADRDTFRLFAHPSYHTGGEVARVRLWDYGLTEAQIADVEEDRDTVDATDPELRADYRFRENLTSHPSAPATTQELTPIGDTSFESRTVDGGAKMTGRFDGGEGYNFDTTADLPRNAYTVVALLRVNDLSSHHRRIFVAGGADVSAHPDGRLSIGGVYTETPVFYPDRFHQVALTRTEDGTLRVYLDGAHVLTRADTDSSGRIGSHQVRFFQHPSGYNAAGHVARARLWDDALTSERIAALDRLVRVKIHSPSEGQRVGPGKAFNGVGASEAGDATEVAVKVYAGATAAGEPVRTLSGPRNTEAHEDEWNTTRPDPTLPSGDYTATAEQTLAGGNSSSSGERHFTVDADPPTPAITHPGDRSKDGTPNFAGTASKVLGDLPQVRLSLYAGSTPSGTNLLSGEKTVDTDESGAWTYTSSVPKLTNGATYTLRVRQLDDVGNEGVTTRTFTVDSVAPVVTIGTTTPRVRTSETTPKVRGTAGILAGDEPTVSIALFSGATATGTNLLPETASATVDATGAYSYSRMTPVLTNGSRYTFRVRQKDAAGHVTDRLKTFTVDTEAPLPSFDAGKPAVRTNVATPDFSGPAGTDTGDLPDIQLDLFAGDVATGTDLLGPKSVTAADGRWSYAAAEPTLADGTYTLRIWQYDTAFNVRSVDRVFTVDRTAPALSLDATAPAGRTRLAAPDFAGIGGTATGDDGSVTLRLYSGTNTSGTNLLPAGAAAPVDATTGRWTFTAASPRLANGSRYTLVVRQADDVGNPKEVVRTFTIDRTPPELAVADDGPPSFTNVKTPAVRGTGGTAAGDSKVVQLELFAGPTVSGRTVLPSAARSATIDATGAWSMTSATPALADGAYTYRVTQRDGAGNRATKLRTFTVDTARPAAATVTATTGAPDQTPVANGDSITSRTVAFAFGGEPFATFRCKLEAAGTTRAYEACASPREFAALADGAYELSVVAVDRAGNEQATPTKFTFTVERGVNVAAGVLSYAAGPGDDLITVRPTTRGGVPVLLVRNTEAERVRPGDGCSELTSIEVTCPAAGVTRVEVSGGDGNDSISAPVAIEARLAGGPGKDRLFGGSSSDVLDGNDGDDLLDGRLGGDTMNGGDGRDAVTYAQRNVPVTASFDGVANDGVRCGAGESPCENDALGQGTGSDVEIVHGGSAADTITGGPGRDFLNGGGGGDTLDGGPGDDELKGQGGDDTLVGGPGPTNTIMDADGLSGGNGIDRADYSARTAALTVSLDGIADDGATGEGDNAGVDVENVRTGAGADSLTGNADENVLEAGDGRDVVDGGFGSDVIDGGAGADQVSYATRTVGVVVDLSALPGAGEADAGNADDEAGDGRRDLILAIEGARGGSARDILTAGLMAGVWAGNGGNDRIEVRNGRADNVECGDGTDAVVADLATIDSRIDSASCETIARG